MDAGTLTTYMWGTFDIVYCSRSFRIEQSICFRMAYNSKVAGHTTNRSEMWDSRTVTLVSHIWGYTFDLMPFKVKWGHWCTSLKMVRSSNTAFHTGKGTEIGTHDNSSAFMEYLWAYSGLFRSLHLASKWHVTRKWLVVD